MLCACVWLLIRDTKSYCLPFRTKCCSEAGNLCLVMTQAKWWRMYRSTPSMVEIFSGIVHGESVQLFNCSFVTKFIDRVVCICCPGQRKWSGMDRATKATGKQTSTVKHGEREIELWLVWHRHWRAATSCSNLPAAVLDRTLFSALRTPSRHTPKNKSQLISFFRFLFPAPVKQSEAHPVNVFGPTNSPCGLAETFLESLASSLYEMPKMG